MEQDSCSQSVAGAKAGIVDQHLYITVQRLLHEDHREVRVRIMRGILYTLWFPTLERRGELWRKLRLRIRSGSLPNRSNGGGQIYRLLWSCHYVLVLMFTFSGRGSNAVDTKQSQDLSYRSPTDGRTLDGPHGAQ